MANNVATIDGFLKGLLHVQVTSISGATALPAAPNYSVMALIQAEAQDVRWIDDGQTPTASFGQLLQAGSTLKYSGLFSSLKFIQVNSGAKLNVTFYGPA